MKSVFPLAKGSGCVTRRETLWFLLSDSALVSLYLLGATMWEFRKADSLRDGFFRPELIVYLSVAVLVWEAALYGHGLYEPAEKLSRAKVVLGVFRSVAIVCLALVGLYYAAPGLRFDPGTVFWPAAVLPGLLLGWRLLLTAPGPFPEHPDRVLIIGTGNTGVLLAREVLSRPKLNMRIVGFLDEQGENIGKSLVNPKILGHVQDVERIVAAEKINRIILSLKEQRGSTPLGPLVRLKFAGVGVESAHSLYEKITGRILVEHVSPSWLILSDGFRKPKLLLASKRLADVAISLVALTFALPLMAMASLAIWLDTGAPILFRQQRVGLWGRPFEMLKFRSMRQDAELDGPRWAEEFDPRITRVGRVIRKYRIDELPQLINVLRGEMSLVGPRPEQLHFCELLRNEDPLFVQRHSIRPGITGWAQIKYRYGSTPEEARTKLGFDLFYIKHLSFLLDLAIVFDTLKVVLAGRGAR